MARLASIAKGGYYPIAPEALTHVLRCIKVPEHGECIIFDPCSGNGDALVQIASALNASPYGVELADDRSEIVKEKIPEGQFLSSTDFLRTRITHGSFSLIYCNPPFDHSAIGNRVERVFIDAAWPLLVDDGLLILICPESVADDWRTTQWFSEYCYDVSAIDFPADYRPFNEVAILGRKRKKLAHGEWIDFYDLKERRFEYVLPAGKKPTTFVKSEPTDEELERLMERSKLNSFLHPVGKQRMLPRPPLSPGDGHIAMLLATGEINGLMEPPGELPHVVRGYMTKNQYLKSSDSDEDGKGNVTTKTVYSERIELVIRMLDSAGNLTTLSTSEEDKNGDSDLES